LRCYTIFTKKYSIYYNANNKSLKIFFIIFLLLFSCFLSGCTENSSQNNDEYEYITLSFEDVNNSLNLAINWLISNINENGFSNYAYDYEKKEYLDVNNLYHQLKISHLIAVLSYKNDSIKEIHKTNLDYIIDNYYIEKNGQGYILFENKSELGVNAITLRILLSSPYSDDYEKYSHKLAETILSMQNDNGSFKHNFLLNYTNNLNIINSDEAILSLIEMYLSTDNKTYLNQSIFSENYFIKNYLSKINVQNNSILIPGHTKALIKLYILTNEDLNLFIVNLINNKILEQQEKVNVSIIGHFLNLESDEKNYSYSSMDGYITEGIAYTYEIFKDNLSVNVSNYKIGLILGIYNLVNLQYYDNNEKINGSIRFGNNNNLIRIDSTQNTINAYLKILDVFKNNDDWNYSYYPELNLLVNNIQKSRLSNIEVWYALFYGLIISIAFIFLVYVSIRINKK